MKFLVNWKVRPIPAEMLKTFVELMPAELEYQKALKDRGKMLSIYPYIGRPEGIAICEAESNEEVGQIISQDPLGLFMEYCVTPLVDFKSSFERYKKALEAAVK